MTAATRFSTSILVFSVLSACGGGARYNWPEFRMAQTPTAESALGLNAVTLVSTDTYTFSANEQGASAKLVRYRRIKVLTPEGARAGEVRMAFSSRMKLISFDGRTTIANGDTQHVRSPNLEEVTIKRPFAEDGVTEYGEVILTLPEVAAGTVVEYYANYEIPDALLIEPILLRDRLPTERAEIVIYAPKTADFDLRWLEGGVMKTVSPVPARPPNPEEQVGYLFVATKLPPLIGEELGPAPSRTGPAVWPIYHGLRSGKGLRMERWEDVGAWVKRRFQLSPSTGNESDAEKLQQAFASEALQLKVKDNGLKLGERNGKPSGDRLGAGMQLYDALAARGFKVGLGLVTRETAGLVLSDAPNPSMIDAIVVAVQNAGKVLYLDPACPSCPIDQVSQPLEGAQVVTVFDDTSRIETLPHREPKDNAFSMTLSSKIGTHADVSGTAQVVLSGAPAAMVRASYLRKDPVELAHELGFLPSVIIENPQAPEGSSSAITFELAFEWKAQCKEEPPAKLRCGVGSVLDKILPELWRESRTQDLLVPATFAHQLVATFQMPTKARVELPQPMVTKTKYGEFSTSYQAEAGQLAVTRRLVLTTRRVSAEHYDDFYNFLQQARQYDTVMPLVDLYPDDKAPQLPAAQPARPSEPEKKPAKKKGKRR